MATQFELDCALMAGASYISTRPDDKNKFPIPDGWNEKVIKRDAQPSGFEATYFTVRSTGSGLAFQQFVL